MRHHTVRHTSIRRIPPAVPTAARPVHVRGVEVFEGTPEDGWAMFVSYTDGTILPARLIHPSLLADFLEYYGLPDEAVSYAGAAREQLTEADPRFRCGRTELGLTG